MEWFWNTSVKYNHSETYPCPQETKFWGIIKPRRFWKGWDKFANLGVCAKEPQLTAPEPGPGRLCLGAVAPETHFEGKVKIRWKKRGVRGRWPQQEEGVRGRRASGFEASRGVNAAGAACALVHGRETPLDGPAPATPGEAEATRTAARAQTAGADLKSGLRRRRAGRVGLRVIWRRCGTRG